MLVDQDGNPVVLPAHVPWSYSALTKFEKCPRSYGEVNVKKNYKFENNPVLDAGNATHQQLDNFVTSGAELPILLRRIGDFVTKLSAKAKEVYPERQINLTHELKPCTVFHDYCVLRVKIDLTLIYGATAIVLDYKTSSEPRETFEQLELSAAAVMIERPDIKEVNAAYVYTKHPVRQMKPIKQEQAADIIKSYIPRLKRLEHARSNDDYPPKPGWWCKWCNVTRCEFYGKK